MKNNSKDVENGSDEEKINTTEYTEYQSTIVDEFWAIIAYICRDPGPLDSSTYTVESTACSLGLVLQRWFQCGISIGEFESRTLDLRARDAAFARNQPEGLGLAQESERGQGQGQGCGGRLTDALTLLLLSWRKKRSKNLKTHCACSTRNHTLKDIDKNAKNNGNSPSLAVFCPVCSADKMPWLKCVHSIPFSSTFILAISNLI